MLDRTPTELLANGALRHGIYDASGALLRYEYIKPEDAPTQAGTPINKASLLKDATAALYGLPASAVPDDVLMAALQIAPWNKIASYETAGAFAWTAPDLYNGKPYKIGVLVIGAGASGAALHTTGTPGNITGGASGHTVAFTLTVTPGAQYNLVVGAGGAAVVASGASPFGNNGGSSSFNGVTALGGERGGNSGSNRGAKGGQCSSFDGRAGFGGEAVPVTNSASTAIEGSAASCFNPFESKRMLGSGGGCIGTSANLGGKDPVSGLGGGDGVFVSAANSKGEDATSAGCGGGAATATGSGRTATSGKGADGAVYIYIRGLLA